MNRNIVSKEVIEIINNSNNNLMNKKKARVYMAKCTLKRRRWTKKMMETHYPKPLEVPNPHYRNAPTMKLYRIAEVLRIEQTAEFIDYWNKIAHKREVARALMIERHRKAKELVLVSHTDGMSNQRA